MSWDHVGSAMRPKLSTELSSPKRKNGWPMGEEERGRRRAGQKDKKERTRGRRVVQREGEGRKRGKE